MLKIKSVMLPLIATITIVSPTVISANGHSIMSIEKSKALVSSHPDYPNVHWHDDWATQQMKITVPQVSQMNLGESLDLTAGTSGTSAFGENIPDITNIPLDYYTFTSNDPVDTSLVISILDPQGRDNGSRFFYTDEYGNHDYYDSKIFTPTKPGTYTIHYMMGIDLSGFVGADRKIIVNSNQSTITAKYVDENGKTISPDVVKSGNVGDKYSTDQKSIDGYAFKEVQGNASGIFTETDEIVTYVYTKNANPTPTVGGNITAKYVDENGKTISSDVVKSGKVGDTYSTAKKSIDGYTFKAVKGNASGTFTDKAQTVTYVYTKNVTPKKPDTPVKPQTPTKPENQDKTKHDTVKKVSKQVKKVGKAVLPQTAAEKVTTGATVSLIVMTSIALAVASFRRKNK